MNNRRYMVYMKSGRKFMVEEIGEPHTDWGNYIPGKGLEKVKSKADPAIWPEDSEITEENGFKNIVMLNPGTSPIAFIDALDKSGLEKFEKLDCGKYL